MYQRRFNLDGTSEKDILDKKVEEAYELLQLTTLSDDQIQLIDTLYKSFKTAIRKQGQTAFDFYNTPLGIKSGGVK